MRTDILILCMSSRLRTRKRGKTLFTYLFQRSVCCWVANRCQRSPYVTESSDLRFIVSVVLMCALCQGENCRVLEGSTPSCYDPSSPTTPQPGVDGNSASTFCTCNVPLHDLNDVGRNWCIYDQARRHRELAKPALTRVQRPTPAMFLWLVTLTFWPQNNCVPRHTVEHRSVTCCDPSCIGFLRSCGKTDRRKQTAVKTQTRRRGNRTVADSQLILRAHPVLGSGLWRFGRSDCGCHYSG